MIKNHANIMELDAILHQPLRTQIVAFLAGRGSATFTELKNTIGASDGNLESHLKKLISADYLTTQKDIGNKMNHNRPQTIYTLTDVGHTALQQYLSNLTRLLDLPQASRTTSEAATVNIETLQAKTTF